MIALTKEQREEIIVFLDMNKYARNLHYSKDYQESLEKLVESIALSSLTAQPVNSADCFCDVYIMPPIPEIKLLNRPANEAKSEYDFGYIDGFDFCMEEIKRLNGLCD